MDFVAIGDTTVDEFIKLLDAEVHCDVSNQNCTISMDWGAKIPFESSSLVYGVGNAANAAVSAARLGLKSAFVSNVGNDEYGKEILENFKNEGVDVSMIKVNDGIPTNHHYVLTFNAERTILIRHEKYHYTIPDGITGAKWIYLSSAGENSETFHIELADWLSKHRETKLAFQPGTFQMSMGKEKLASLYAVSSVVAVNKEEAEKILGEGESPVEDLLKKMHDLGPKIVLITDGPNGAYVFDGDKKLKIPMYPDPKPPENRTGAGDAMTSTFVAALAVGKTIEEALLWGPINSMSVVQHTGAQKGLLTRDKLETYLRDAPDSYRVAKI